MLSFGWIKITIKFTQMSYFSFGVGVKDSDNSADETTSDDTISDDQNSDEES